MHKEIIFQDRYLQYMEVVHILFGRVPAQSRTRRLVLAAWRRCNVLLLLSRRKARTKRLVRDWHSPALNTYPQSTRVRSHRLGDVRKSSRVTRTTVESCPVQDPLHMIFIDYQPQWTKLSCHGCKPPNDRVMQVPNTYPPK